MFDQVQAALGNLNLPGFVPAILIGLAIAGGCYAVLRMLLANRKRIRQLEEWRDRPPLLFIIFKPLILLFASDIRGVMSDAYIESSRKKLSAGGLSYAIMPEEFFTLKLVCWLVAIAMVLAVYSLDIGLTPLVMLILGLVVLLGFFYPDLWLRDRINKRRHMVAKDFPFLLDLLVLSMRAGLNYSSSLAQAISSLPQGPVREEFSKLLREIRAGKTRREALDDLAVRMNVSTITNFVGAMKQAEETGGEVVSVLTAQAEQRRTERFNNAEEVANKAPVRMLIPMMTFLFPIIFMLMGFVMVVKLAEIDILPQSMIQLLLS